MTVRVSVKLIIPTKKFSSIPVIQKLQEAIVEKTERDILKDFEGTVAGWHDRPDFRSDRIFNSRSVGIKVYPYGRGLKQYNIVNFGSPAHIITARRPSGRLSFQSGYIAATQPGSLLSGSASRFGGGVNTYSVNHPGFPARDFGKQIADKYSNQFATDMQAAVTEAVKDWQ